MPLRAAFARFAATAALAAVAAPSLALGPHETALVVNSESTASVLLGETWARLRGVPRACVVRIPMPRGEDGSFPLSTDFRGFLDTIWTPATNALSEAGVAPQILAWVYSCDFPVRIDMPTNGVSPRVGAAVSLAGATFLRGRPPDGGEISGSYASPLFAGPGPGGGDEARGAQSLDRLRNKFLQDCPLPSAMLAWTGERGMTLSEARSALRRAAEGDFASPTGALFFAKSGDVRWNTRAWSVENACAGAAARAGTEAVVSTNSPASFSATLLGLFAGDRSVPAPGGAFAPGAYADHLTSYAAAFEKPSQMKATEWLKRGAAFTSGTVAEPLAMWQKFPTAAVFAHRFDGCTALEALFLATRCPLQLQPFGDPLSAPWAPRIEPRIEEDAASRPGRRFFRAALAGGGAVPPGWRCTWLLDGVQAGSARTFALPADSAARFLRLVLRDDFRVRHQGFAEIDLLDNSK